MYALLMSGVTTFQSIRPKADGIKLPISMGDALAALSIDSQVAATTITAHLKKHLAGIIRDRVKLRKLEDLSSKNIYEHPLWALRESLRFHIDEDKARLSQLLFQAVGRLGDTVLSEGRFYDNKVPVIADALDVKIRAVGKDIFSVTMRLSFTFDR